MTVWTSEDGDLAAEDTTVPGLMATATARWAGRTALVDGTSGRRVTHGELDGRVAAIAAWLADQGVGPGARVGIVAPNVPPAAAFTLAALRLGAATAPLNPTLTAYELARELDDARTEVMAAAPPLVEAVRATGRDRVAVLGDPVAGAVPLSEVLATAAGPAPDRTASARGPDDPAVTLRSSGTTAAPHAVGLSHRHLVAAVRQLSTALALTDDDVTLAIAPFFHVLGLTAALLAPLAAGAAVVTVPRFSPAEAAALIERHRVTYLAIPPPVAAALAGEATAGYDLSSLRLVAVGGAPMGPGLQARLAARLPGAAVGEGYGLTETAGVVCVPRAGEGSRPGTVGRPVAGTDLCVRDPATGATLGPEQAGELCVRGPQVAAGDGWLATGDLARVDEAGNVTIVDRIKDLIKVNALAVSPTEVEAALRDHPAVADVAVVAVPDPRTGERPVAHVVTAGHVADDDLDAWAAARLAPHKRPARYHRVAALPRTPSGKVLRRALAATPA